jgi:hypothetical protein
VLARCVASVTTVLPEANPDMGRNVAMDGSDMPAYAANGQRHLFDDGPGARALPDRTASGARASGAGPTGECKPASVWIKASRLHPLILREIRATASSTVAAPPWNASSDA